MSMGIGTVVPSRDDCIADFLDLVDQRLYKAKRDGRNRIVFD
jgi:PleD family two-component response regulator